jgi:hypothetical protein
MLKFLSKRITFICIKTLYNKQISVFFNVNKFFIRSNKRV